MLRSSVAGESLAKTTSVSAWTRLAHTSELRGDGPFALSANGLDLVVVRTETGLKAYQGRCPHQGALLFIQLARFLQDRVDIDAVPRQNGTHLGENAGPIADS